MRKLSQMIMSATLLVTLALAAPYALAQQDTKPAQPTAGGQMKEGGKEMGKAGKSMGANVKHGRIARGGKHFGKHVAHGSKNIAKGTAQGTKTAAKKTTHAVKKAVTP
jgi:hypothetical protein